MRISKPLYGPKLLGIILLWGLTTPLAMTGAFAQAEISAGCG